MKPATPRHQFSKLEIKQAEHEFAEYIKRYFGEIWKIKSDGEYKGVYWDCLSMLSLDAGLWRLLHQALMRGATRAAGRIEVRDTGYLLRFILFYEATGKTEESPIIKV